MLLFYNAVQIIYIGMEAVKAQLVAHPQHNQDAAGHAQRQPENIDKREHLVPQQIPESYFEVILKHRCSLFPGHIGYNKLP
jgi:hypothetical protein